MDILVVKETILEVVMEADFLEQDSEVDIPELALVADSLVDLDLTDNTMELEDHSLEDLAFLPTIRNSEAVSAPSKDRSTIQQVTITITHKIKKL